MTKTEQKLSDDLLRDFEGFQKIQEAGGSKEANKKVAEDLAHSIYECVKNGCVFELKGCKSVSEINNLYEKNDGDVWIVNDDGYVLNDDLSEVCVENGDLIRYENGSWTVISHIEIDDFVKKETFDAAIAALTAMIESITIPQSDWDEFDETSGSYIKNKPVVITNEQIDDLFLQGE